MARMHPEVLRLYLVTDSELTRGRTLTDVVEAAVQGGVTCVQLREKHASTQAFVELALALKAIVARHGVPLVINDRIDIALACKADGVHLGQSDMPVELARRMLPPEVFIGWSVETHDDVVRSAHADVDYLGVSPVFATPTKTDTKTPWGLDGLATVRGMTTLPLVAIGGLNVGNVRDVMSAGANGIAVVSAICSAESPKLAARELRALMEEVKA